MNRSRSSSRQPSWPYPPEYVTVEKLARLEITQDHHSERLDDHETRHDNQDVWNKGFAVALAGLGAGLAHAKADGLADLLAAILKVWKP